MRIVIDTNVLLSGLLWHGAPHTLFNQARDCTVDLMMSQEVLDSLIIKYQARRWDSARTAAPEKKAASVKRQASVTVTR